MRLVFVALLLAVTASPALARRKPEIVIPGKPGVPVIINGTDAFYGIVEGEFGLDQPGLVAPAVVYRPLLTAYPTGPRTISVPPPDRPLPPPEPTYYRSWSSSSGNSAPVPTVNNVMTSMASACCGGWGYAAPVAYAEVTPVAYGGCGNCGAPTAAVVYSQPVAPAPIAVNTCCGPAWGGTSYWGNGGGCCGGSGARAAAPSPGTSAAAIAALSVGAAVVGAAAGHPGAATIAVFRRFMWSIRVRSIPVLV